MRSCAPVRSQFPPDRLGSGVRALSEVRSRRSAGCLAGRFAWRPPGRPTGTSTCRSSTPTYAPVGLTYQRPAHGRVRRGPDIARRQHAPSPSRSSSARRPRASATQVQNAVGVTGGAVTAAALESGSDTVWDVTVTLSSTGTLTLTLGLTESCSDNGAICTERRQEAVERDRAAGSSRDPLTLSNLSVGLLTDSEEIGTIKNHDPMPVALIARFGRTAAVHVVDPSAGPGVRGVPRRRCRRSGGTMGGARRSTRRGPRTARRRAGGRLVSFTPSSAARSAEAAGPYRAGRAWSAFRRPIRGSSFPASLRTGPRPRCPSGVR